MINELADVFLFGLLLLLLIQNSLIKVRLHRLQEVSQLLHLVLQSLDLLDRVTIIVIFLALRRRLIQHKLIVRNGNLLRLTPQLEQISSLRTRQLPRATAVVVDVVVVRRRRHVVADHGVPLILLLLWIRVFIGSYFEFIIFGVVSGWLRFGGVECAI